MEKNILWVQVEVIPNLNKALFLIAMKLQETSRHQEHEKWITVVKRIWDREIQRSKYGAGLTIAQKISSWKRLGYINL